MSKLKEWEHHVRRDDDHGIAWCGAALTQFDWVFQDRGHARLSIETSRLQPCPDCLGVMNTATNAVGEAEMAWREVTRLNVELRELKDLREAVSAASSKGDKELGRLFKRRRKDKGLKVGEVAFLLGVSAAYVSMRENGQAPFSLSEFREWCVAVGLEVSS